MSVNHLLNSLELRHKITEVIAYYFAPLPNFLECQLAPIFLSRYQPQHHLLPHLDKACGRNKFSCGETASWHSQFPNGSMQAKKPDRPDPAFCCLPLIYVLRCNKEYWSGDAISGFLGWISSGRVEFSCQRLILRECKNDRNELESSCMQQRP